MKTYSYDVFDTCLTRTVASPGMLFYRLAADLLPASATRSEVAELAQLRIQAERNLRKESPNGEVSLDAIYRVLGETRGLPVDGARMQAHELTLERRSLRVVPAMRREIDARRKTGARILFISDMYLPAAFIKEQLIRHGIAETGDPVYVSCEHGVSKRSGGLLERVMREESLSPSAWVHTGDNPAADVHAPRRLGIEPVEVTDSRLSPYEALLSDPGHGTWETSFAAGAARLCRLDVLDLTGDAVQSLVIGDVIAPLLTGFAAWSLAQAERDGIRRLYFVARDGELPLAAAERLSAATNGAEVRYLYGSRRAWFLASTQTVTRETLAWICQPNTERSLHALLGRLELDPGSMVSSLEKHGLAGLDRTQDLSPSELERFWGLVEDPEISNRILARAEYLRSRVLGYLEQEGVFEGTPAALVDLGWNARCQAALNRIISVRDPDRRLGGYYLALAPGRVKPEVSGPYRGWFVKDPPPLPRGPLVGRLVRNRTLVEQCFAMPSHASTQGYLQTGDRWEPQLAPFAGSDELSAFHRALRHGILGYADELAAYLNAGGRLFPILDAATRCTDRFLARPSREEAEVFQRVQVTNDPHERSFAAMVRPFSVPDLVRLVWHAVGMRSRPRDFRNLWLEGCAALSPGWVRGPLRWALGVRRNG